VRSYFVHKRIRVFIEQQDETFRFGFKIGGQEIQGTTRTRLPELAKRRATTLVDRKLREAHRAAKAKD
jgi:hypothetical protein